MNMNEVWIQRCIQLALNGSRSAAPNPMVGAVLVGPNGMLAEGWHRAHGGPHAEVECLRAFGDGPIPDDATLYVNLEPCAHHGLTPPCVDLLIARGVRSLVVGCADPNPLTQALKGIARAREAGMRVREGVLLDQCRWLNRRFMTSMEEQRPYVILKWAQSTDGFLDQHPRSARRVQRITASATDVMVHTWRAEEQAILVGSRTALNDDPVLNVRHVDGRPPLRVVLDRNAIAPADSKVFNDGAPTLIVTNARRADVQCDQMIVGHTDDPIEALLSELQRRSIRSVLVEGGAELLDHFIRTARWDEARVITGTPVFGNGTKAPTLNGTPSYRVSCGSDDVAFHTRIPVACASWAL